jgi:dienelactone hydrolase
MECIQAEQEIEGKSFEHLVFIDPTYKEHKGAVHVYPAYGGRDQVCIDTAKKLAKMGYKAVAIDPYGQAVVGTTPEESTALMKPLVEDRAYLIKRLTAFWHFLEELEPLKNLKHAGVGFCFGGLCVLDLARSGIQAGLFISVHGTFGRAPFKTVKVKTPVLALHGYKDPFVPFNQLESLCLEMEELQADFAVHIFGVAEHSFTNPKADGTVPGVIYNKEADSASWELIANNLARYL